MSPDPIELPDYKPMSALDGMTTMALDTDPESNLYGVLSNADARGLTVLAVVPHKFHGVRPGYLVLLYDPKQDPRNEEANGVPHQDT